MPDMPTQQEAKTFFNKASELINSAYDNYYEKNKDLPQDEIPALVTSAFALVILQREVKKFSQLINYLLGKHFDKIEWDQINKFFQLSGKKLVPSDYAMNISKEQFRFGTDLAYDDENSPKTRPFMLSPFLTEKTYPGLLSNNHQRLLAAFLQGNHSEFLSLQFSMEFLFPDYFASVTGCMILLYQRLMGYGVQLDVGDLNQPSIRRMTEASPLRVAQSLVSKAGSSEKEQSEEEKRNDVICSRLNTLTFFMLEVFKASSQSNSAAAKPYSEMLESALSKEESRLQLYWKVHFYQFLQFVIVNEANLTSHFLTLRLCTNPPPVIDIVDRDIKSFPNYAEALIRLCADLACPERKAAAMAVVRAWFKELPFELAKLDSFQDIKSSLLVLEEEDLFICLHDFKSTELCFSQAGAVVNKAAMDPHALKAAMPILRETPTTRQVQEAFAASGKGATKDKEEGGAVEMGPVSSWMRRKQRASGAGAGVGGTGDDDALAVSVSRGSTGAGGGAGVSSTTTANFFDSVSTPSGGITGVEMKPMTN
jgi:hypothetical protein